MGWPCCPQELRDIESQFFTWNGARGTRHGFHWKSLRAAIAFAVMGAPVFEMENVTVQRGGRKILSDIFLRVERDQHWVIVGGNGSGKTSLLNVLMGYLTPTEGEVHMRGREDAVNSKSQSWDDWRKRIGFVSSSISELIEPGETALDIIMAGRHAMVNYWQKTDDPKVIKAAEKVLERVDCTYLRDQPWAQFSQGERQRLLIGRALMAPRMDVLILDEPCAGLDPVAREHFLQFVQELTEKGSFRSLLMVTHHVEEIIPAITHALVLKEGAVVSQGEKRRALNSLSLSRAFDSDLRLRSRLGRYRLYYDDEFIPEGGQVV
ncbi:MAG: ATP-binding cassette domain-containing protein [Verrucomicrobiota bacterium]